MVKNLMNDIKIYYIPMRTAYISPVQYWINNQCYIAYVWYDAEYAVLYST